MILETLLDGFLAIVSVILTPISWVTAPIGSVAGLVELMSYASIFMPVQALGVSLGVYVAFHAFGWSVTVANWLISKIPTIS